VLVAMDTALMLWIHRHATPALDTAFVFSARLGSLWLCGPLVLLAAAWHESRRERREAVAWLVLGLLAAVVPELLKLAVQRPRPALWAWLLPAARFSFPSGHAMASAAFYPFLGWLGLRTRGLGGLGYASGLAVAAFVGVGRLYVGVHWPTDVLAGWALGAALSSFCSWKISLPSDRR
jgi:membrane-associated phospholipid phosphatase